MSNSLLNIASASITEYQQHNSHTTVQDSNGVITSSNPVVKADSSMLNNRTAIVDSALLDNTIAGMDTISLTSQENAHASQYESNKEGKTLPVKLLNSDAIFALLLVCFILLAYVYNGGFNYIKENISLTLSESKSKKLEAQITIRERVEFYFLIFLAAVFFSISLYEGLDKLIPLAGKSNRYPFMTVASFAILITVFIYLKVLFIRLIGYVFNKQEKAKTWNQSYLVLISISGLLSFIPTLILVYSDWLHDVIIGLCLILFLIVHLILFFRIIVFFIKQKLNFLYLIAYLCTVEILPYIYVGVGLVYLYKVDIFNTIL